MPDNNNIFELGLNLLFFLQTIRKRFLIYWKVNSHTALCKHNACLSISGNLLF